MNKFFVAIVAFFMTITSAFCENIRFVQVEGVCINANNPQSVQKLNELTEKINRLKNVDFVVFSGNNIDRAERAYLQQFITSAKNLDAPFYVVIGNKDVNKMKDFGKKEYINMLRLRVLSHLKISSPDYVFIKKNNVFIVVDGSKEVIPSANGYYKPETLAWLKLKLQKYKDKNVYIIQHFPITLTGASDSNFTYKPEKYLALLSENKNVKAVIAGNYNIDSEEEIDGIIHITTSNAPCYKIIDISDAETLSPTIWTTIGK